MFWLGRRRRARDEDAGCRARIIAAADEARGRIARDLHDGAQQRLVSLALDLRAVQASVPSELADVKAQLARVVDKLAEAVADLQDLARAIHPPILRSGVGPAVRALARRSPVPVEVHVCVAAQLPEPVGLAVYYVVAEALANVAKHARAGVVRIRLETHDDAVVCLEIGDDGIGGALPGGGAGLNGLGDRVEALGGTLTITSPPGRGTTLPVAIPLPSPVGPPGRTSV
jgi:signal transduction histidine kinase